MFYTFEVDGGIKIDSSSGAGENASIRKIILMSDTKDPHVSQRSNSVLFRVEIDVLINKDTKEVCKKLMKWALQDRGNDLYRKVDITIKDDNEEVLRYFSIPDMFCEDYKEVYLEDNDKQQDKCVFNLKLIQKGGNFSEIENENS